MLDIKAQGVVEVYFHTFLLRILVGIRWSASLPSHVSPGKTPGTHLIEGSCVVWTLLEERKISCSCQESNQNPSVLQSRAKSLY